VTCFNPNACAPITCCAETCKNAATRSLGCP
jgi:hypothetical protein